MNDTTPQYPQDFIDKAEKRIKAQLEGNGVETKSLSLKINRSGIDTLTAETTYEMDAKIDQKQIKGKATGGKIIPQGQLQSEIKTYLAEIASKDSIETTAKEKIKTLPLKGFGADKEKLELGGERQTLTEHVNCNACQAQGKMKCPKCQGLTKVKCPKCFGRGEMQCDICLGHGRKQDGSQCHNCHGKGEVYCYYCQGKKQIPCTHCHMKGQITCTQCKGDGVNTNQATISAQLVTKAAINIQDMDYDPKRMAGKIGGLTLAQGGHITVKAVNPPEKEEEERAYYEDEPEDLTSKTVYYEAEFPWAVTHLIVNKQKHDVSFVGLKGAVCDSGTFMEQITQKSLEKMDRAAQGKENAHQAIKEACTLRVSRETFAFLGKGKPKKVMHHIHKTYPLGWNKKSIQTYVMTSFKALQKATQRPRYIGLAVGLGITLGLCYGWFMGGMRMSFGIDYPLAFLFEGLPLMLGLCITIASIKGVGFFIYQSLMRNLGIKSSKTPPMGKAGLYAVLGVIAIWGGFFAAGYLGLY